MPRCARETACSSRLMAHSSSSDTKRCTTKTPTTGATTSSTNRDSAGAGRNRVFGEDGNDFIAAGVHNDRVDGGAGDDEIDSGKDLDHLTGGAGRDLFFSADSSIDQLF